MTKEEIKDMINNLPQEQFNEDKTFLDPLIGNGQILEAVYKKKMDLNQDPYKIAMNVYGVDTDENNVLETKKKLSTLMKKYLDMFAPDCISAAIMHKDINKLINERITHTENKIIDWKNIVKDNTHA